MAGHGSRPLRGLESTAQSSIKTGKFGRLFRWLPPGFQPRDSKDEDAIEKLLTQLASLMISTEFNDRIDDEGESFPDQAIDEPEPADENSDIASGYTYLGQFIDHDITFDPASSLQQQNDPDALEDFRTPRLDLDSLYGSGPDDQPYLYDKTAGRLKFRLGPKNVGVAGQFRPDVLRTDDDTALIGDKRNDENKIVRQLQVLFLRFHNKVFDGLAARFPGPADQGPRFQEAQRIVRWTYQYLVVHDYLRRNVCKQSVLDAILPGAGEIAPHFRFYNPHSGDSFMPVEFSVAAFRFGHSMVRPSYKLNDIAKSTAKFTSKAGKVVDFQRIPVFVAQSAKPTDAMNGFGEPLPDKWGIDWAFFFGKPPQQKKGVKQVPQPSYRIDATLVDPLGALPEFVPSVGATSPFASLAFRNLMRGFRMGLPSGQAVAGIMGVKALSDQELWQKKADGDTIKAWPEGKAFFDANKQWLEGRAPLWYYILKEAEIHEKGHRLGEVGSRIVAETLIGLIWFDHFSYLFQAPAWDPGKEGIAGLSKNLDMLKLTQFVG
jgi:hypothetical protein